tara:strand:+ start:52 stop:351 length:300 start_codon:yes stop_codon:yes gene_type:complete
MKYETVQEFLSRGGKIRKNEESSGGSMPAGVHPHISYFPYETTTLKALSWSEVIKEEEDRVIDTQYWKDLNKAIDKELLRQEQRKLDIQEKMCHTTSMK